MTVSHREPMSPFERHVRLLLRAYPPCYRMDRGEEILDTLLEASAERQEWPSFRDSRSLLAGGIRARADRNRAVGLAASLRLAAILGLSMYLTQNAASWLLAASLFHGVGLPHYLRPAVELAVIAGAWLGLRVLAVPAAAAAIVLEAMALSGSPLTYQLPLLLPVALSLAALAVLTRRGGGPPVSWLGLAATPLMVLAVREALPGSLFEQSSLVVLALAGIATLIWLITDIRPAFGCGLFLAISQLAPIGNDFPKELELGWSPFAIWRDMGSAFVYLALGLVVTAGMAFLLARRSRPKATIR